MSETTWGLVLAESVKVRFPDRVPVVEGLKVMEAVQLAPAARVLGLRGQVELTWKSLKLLTMLLMVSVVD